MDNQNLYEQCNFSYGDVRAAAFSPGGWTAALDQKLNRTVIGTRLNVFLCPSDSNPGYIAEFGGKTNYGVNFGPSRKYTGWIHDGSAAIVSELGHSTDAGRNQPMISNRDFTDGTSKTALYS